MIRMVDWSRTSTVLVWLLLGAAIGGASVWFVVRGARPEPPTAVVDLLTAPATHFDWTQPPSAHFPMPPFARYLKDVSIVLDPGHGGRAYKKNWKRGPTGLREAEVNLRVAQFLRDFLIGAGARVVMTRDADVYLDKDEGKDLRLRSAMANDRNADLLLSIHHNGVNGSPANYTSVFYHSTPDHSPPSLDAARWLLAGLNDSLRLEQHLECGLVSDHAVIPKGGFGVLRRARVPAVLVESSFFTNPEEEDRLRDPLYNRREAYGLFVGLARWAAAGLPRVKLLEANGESARRNGNLMIELEDGLAKRRGFGSDLPQIHETSIKVTLNGENLPFRFDQRTKRVSISGASARAARDAGRLHVDFVNTSGQHVLHPWLDLPGR